MPTSDNRLRIDWKLWYAFCEKCDKKGLDPKTVAHSLITNFVLGTESKEIMVPQPIPQVRNEPDTDTFIDQLFSRNLFDG